VEGVPTGVGYYKIYPRGGLCCKFVGLYEGVAGGRERIKTHRAIFPSLSYSSSHSITFSSSLSVLKVQLLLSTGLSAK